MPSPILSGMVFENQVGSTIGLGGSSLDELGGCTIVFTLSGDLGQKIVREILSGSQESVVLSSSVTVETDDGWEIYPGNKSSANIIATNLDAKVSLAGMGSIVPLIDSLRLSGSVVEYVSGAGVMINVPLCGDFDGTLDGCTIVLHDEDSTHLCYRTIISGVDSAGNISVVLDRAPSFALTAGCSLEVFPPGFNKIDRSRLDGKISEILQDAFVELEDDSLAKFGDAVAEQDEISAALITIGENLDAPVSSVASGGAGADVIAAAVMATPEMIEAIDTINSVTAPGTPIDPTREPVPDSRTFVLVDDPLGFRSENVKTIIVNVGPTVYAVDFRNHCSSNQKIFNVNSAEFVSGSGSGLSVSALDDWDVNGGTQARFELQGLSPGDYTVRVNVTYINPGTHDVGDMRIRVVS